MTNGLEVARTLAKSSSKETSYARQQLIDLCIVEDLGRGKPGFVIPYIPHYLSEEAYERSFSINREDRWFKEV